MASSAPFKIEFYVGDTHAVQFTVKDQDNDPIDLSAGSGSLELKTVAGVIEVTVPGAIVDGPAGIVAFEFEPGDTSGMDPGAYVYTARVTTATGKIYTVAALNPAILLAS